MLHLIEHTFHDIGLMFPLLYLSYCVIEYFERKNSIPNSLFDKLQKYGPIVGAFVGIIPQCGFSMMASMLFLNKNITLGTLMSVFIATSDEAIPILIASPQLYSVILIIIFLKIGVGILVGYVVDYVLFPRQKLNALEESEEEEEEVTSTCPCCYEEYPLIISAFLRSLKIFTFVFIITLILNSFLHDGKEEVLGHLLLNHSFFQPVIASLIGFIPNCIASVVLTQLYIAHQVTFASLVSGLMTNSGLGLLLLIRYRASRKEIVQVILILFVSAIVTGGILQIIQ